MKLAYASLVSLAACGGAAGGSGPVVPPSAARVCDVWDREVSFARSVAMHDEAAFAEHVHPNAVFVDGDGTLLRGREAIVTSWRSVIEGKTLRLAWHPSDVVLLGDGQSALSRGPYLAEDLRPDAKHRYLRGTFQSVWTRDGDVWRVTVDGGTPSPVPATDEEARAIERQLRAECPGR